jgi:hypothetical protein
MVVLNGSYEPDSAFRFAGMLPSLTSEWALVGPYIDNSLVRNAWTYNISNQMGRWAPGACGLDAFACGFHALCQPSYVALQRRASSSSSS